MKTPIISKVYNPGEHPLEEWLVTNGIGGFACGSISGAPTRRYHSILNAALPAPYGRTNMLNYALDSLILPNNKEIPLSSLYFSETEKIACECLKEFHLNNGIPIWIYEIDGVKIEKSLFLIHRQNTVQISYKLISSDHPIVLKWTPFFHFRKNEQSVDALNPNESYTVHSTDFQYEIECPDYPLLRIFNDALAPFIVNFETFEGVFYKIEESRGYPSKGSLKSPGFFLIPLKRDQRITLIASTESWETIFALTSQDAWMTEKMRKRNLLKTARKICDDQNFLKLALAADQFLISPTSRYNDMIRLQAAGEEVRSIIAGFPWFTDWGRDTMISLEGLTLTTGRIREAYSILHTFAYYVKEGLIPNMFPDGQTKGLYNTADASLLFFHAIDRYISITHDEEILNFLLPKLQEIIHFYLKGTLFGIRVDEKDGLLVQGQEGYQLTWMDAKVDNWVVTPRRGKAVELNGLWYNALRLFEKWSGTKMEIADLCFHSFNQKFWYGEGNYLYDVIEGESGHDTALRPNQLFAIALSYPVLQKEYWKPVLDTVKKELLTPLGLRTLSTTHPEYKSCYDGDLRARDSAYHQGTVWPWLIGPFIDVWLKVHPDAKEEARSFLNEILEHLNEYCIGTIGEIFDACPPYKPRGCFAQAWSVAELIRCIYKLMPEKE